MAVPYLRISFEISDSATFLFGSLSINGLEVVMAGFADSAVWCRMLSFSCYCKSAFSFDELVSHRWAQLMLEPSGREMSRQRKEAAKGKDGTNWSFHSFNPFLIFFFLRIYYMRTVLTSFPPSCPPSSSFHMPPHLFSTAWLQFYWHLFFSCYCYRQTCMKPDEFI